MPSITDRACVRTGQAQAGSFDAGAFKAEVCKQLTAPIDCAGLQLDVRHFSDFSSSDLTDPIDGSGNLKTNFTYDPGGPGDIVVVRAFYEWDLIAKFPKDIALSNMANGNRLLMSTTAFRNEPFAPPGAGEQDHEGLRQWFRDAHPQSKRHVGDRVLHYLAGHAGHVFWRGRARQRTHSQPPRISGGEHGC